MALMNVSPMTCGMIPSMLFHFYRGISNLPRLCNSSDLAVFLIQIVKKKKSL